MDDPAWISRRCGDQISMKQVVAVAFHDQPIRHPETGAQPPAVRALTLNPRWPRIYSNIPPRCRIFRVYLPGDWMTIAREEIEALRLLRAFEKIKDRAKRREIIELVEAGARAAKQGPNVEKEPSG
jgi:hypothetical protein